MSAPDGLRLADALLTAAVELLEATVDLCELPYRERAAYGMRTPPNDRAFEALYAFMTWQEGNGPLSGAKPDAAKELADQLNTYIAGPFAHAAFGNRRALIEATSRYEAWRAGGANLDIVSVRLTGVTSPGRQLPSTEQYILRSMIVKFAHVDFTEARQIVDGVRNSEPFTLEVPRWRSGDLISYARYIGFEVDA
jgi:hypothetical protein